MKKMVLIFALLSAAGCSQQGKTEDAMQAMFDGCAQPIRGSLTLDQWGNKLVLECSEFKPQPAK